MESVADAFKGSIGSLMAVLPDICDKHSTENKKVHMVKIIKTGEVMCPECYREQHIKPKLHAMEKEMITKKYRGYLRRYSLVDRKSTFDYSFDTFKYKTGSLEEQKYRDIYRKNKENQVPIIFDGKEYYYWTFFSEDYIQEFIDRIKAEYPEINIY